MLRERAVPAFRFRQALEGLLQRGRLAGRPRCEVGQVSIVGGDQRPAVARVLDGLERYGDGDRRPVLPPPLALVEGSPAGEGPLDLLPRLRRALRRDHEIEDGPAARLPRGVAEEDLGANVQSLR